MLLNFKPQFVPFILDGSKTHTIRGLRKDGKVPKAGETCHCYTGLRRKGAQLLGRWPCVKVEEIRITETVRNGPRIFIAGGELSHSEMVTFAWRDGFRDFGERMALAEMMMFWKGRLPFLGHVTHWRFDRKAS